VLKKIHAPGVFVELAPSPLLRHLNWYTYICHIERRNTKREVRKMNILAVLSDWEGWLEAIPRKVYELPKRKLRKILSALNFLCFVAIRENRKMAKYRLSRNKRGQ
jgi:hypothetical protein